MATQDFYPASGANSPVDGSMEKDDSPGTGVSFATIRGRTTADAAYPTVNGVNIIYLRGQLSGFFDILIRGIILFDISTLPANATITGATLKIYPTASNDGFGGNSIGLVSGTPASNNNLVVADYNITNFGSTEYASRIALSAISINAYNTFTLNGSGVTFLQTAQSGGNIVKFGLLHSSDIDNAAPTGISKTDYVAIATAEDTTQAKRPVLTITYTTPVANQMQFNQSLTAVKRNIKVLSY